MEAGTVASDPLSTPRPAGLGPQTRQRLADLRRQDVAAPEGRSKPAIPLSRRQILDVTDACLRELGYDGTTIRKIAGRLDCAVGTIYRYFPDKRTLLGAVTQRRFEPVAREVEAGAPLAATARAYAATAHAEPQQYRLMFWLTAVDPDRPALPHIVQQIVAGWSAQLDDRRAGERFWAQLHGGVMLNLPPDQAVPDLEPTADADVPEVPAREDVTLL